jgi:hypothetical protein
MKSIRNLFRIGDNRLSKARHIDVNSLPSGFLMGCIPLLFLVCQLCVGAFIVNEIIFNYRYPDGIPAEEVVAAELPTLTPTTEETSTNVPSSTPSATLVPTGTYTPEPSSTPEPTTTPVPTSQEIFETPTPIIIQVQQVFTTDFQIPAFPTFPPPTPIRYSYSQIAESPGLVTVDSEYPWGFYQAFCLPNVGQERVVVSAIGVPQQNGIYYRMWNDYGYVHEKEYLEEQSDLAFLLSTDPSTWHFQIFFYNDAISDQVDVEFPGECPRVRLVWVQSTGSPVAPNVEVANDKIGVPND